MTKPTFLCIGVCKGGTTSLINYLNFHPEIYMHPTEIHFFDDAVVNDTTIINYEKNFITSKQIIGEKTPAYHYLQYSIEHIYNYYPDIKLILLLREPISRAYSQYNMDKPNELDFFLTNILQEKDLKLNELQKRGKHYIVRGFYDEQIEYIYSKFPKENIYIGISEELQNNKNYEYGKIYKFLRASEKIEINVNEISDVHIRPYKRNIRIDEAKVLYDIYKPHLEKLYSILGRKIDIWEKYYETLK